jgi:hypothetical protein
MFVVIILNVVLNVVLLGFIMLNTVLLNAVTASVIAQFRLVFKSTIPIFVKAVSSI